jgi:hypothetical protein
MDLRKNPVVEFLSAPSLTFVVWEKRIAHDFFDNLKLLGAVPASKYNVSGFEAQSVRACHGKGFAKYTPSIR